LLPKSVEANVVPQAQVADADTLESLKQVAVARAEALGHHLQAFQAAKRDPLCCVSFCRDCRQMVLLSLAAPAGSSSALLGYALVCRCEGQRDARRA
jgi:hypothetical protein